jgi:hypothetical protein
MTKKKIWWIVGGVAVVLVTISVMSGSNSHPVAQTGPTYTQLAQQRFDGIKTSIPELKDVQCLDNSCDNSVVYFDFNTMPSDLETVIRGNAATFSKFETDNKHGSSVTVIARLGSNEVFQCDASDGKVTTCH